jgi:hypothetical protein
MPLIAINTIDTSDIPPSFALNRVTNLNTDGGGVTIQLKTGEKIKSIFISPRYQIKAIPLDGILCQEKCSGSAPTTLSVFTIKPVIFPSANRLSDGSSFLTITTNSESIYKFRIRPGTPQKRTLIVR